MSLTINNNKIYITIPDEYSYVYEKILKRMISLESSLLNDCDSTCKSVNKQVTICWNMFQAACAAYQRNEFKKANLFINYIKACLKNKVNDDMPKVKSPTISFTNNVVTITADNEGSVLMYRTIDDKKWTTYTQPIQLEYGIYIIAKAIYKGVESNETNPIFCIYTPKPIINCFKNIVNITNCSISSQIKYKINSGSYIDYSEPFAIDETCVVTGKVIDSNEYGTNEIESIPTECEYLPVINFTNIQISTYDSSSSKIKFKVNVSGSIETNVKVAYSDNNTKPTISGTVETCTYNPSTQLYETDDYISYTTKKYIRCYAESANAGETSKIYSDTYVLEDNGGVPALNVYQPILPTVTTYGNVVTINNVEPSVAILYKIDNGSYQSYSTPFQIDHTVTVTAKVVTTGGDELYSTPTTCNYVDPTTIPIPVMRFNNNKVSFSQHSSLQVDIYYKKNDGVDTWHKFGGIPFSINQTTSYVTKGIWQGVETNVSSPMEAVYTPVPIVTCYGNTVTITT